MPHYHVYFYYHAKAENPEEALAKTKQVLDATHSQMYCYHHRTEEVTE